MTTPDEEDDQEEIMSDDVDWRTNSEFDFRRISITLEVVVQTQGRFVYFFLNDLYQFVRFERYDVCMNDEKVLDTFIIF